MTLFHKLFEDNTYGSVHIIFPSENDSTYLYLTPPGKPIETRLWHHRALDRTPQTFTQLDAVNPVRPTQSSFSVTHW